MISNKLRNLLAEATTHVQRYQDGGDHTVAAALLTESGKHVLGLNAFHFLGGPCGEVSALANHAASYPEDPIQAVVAVYGPTGQVVPPCGKCRQVLFDVNPSIRCIVRGSNGLEAPTVGELLPFAFDWRDLEKEQRIYMWEGYEELIRSGEKQQTIRVDDPFREGSAQIVFEKESGEVVTIPAQVTSVVSTRRSELSEEQAKNDGFGSLTELQEALDTHYPGLAADDEVDIVEFKLQ
ncbi:CMP deaminase [Corynebacterium sp. HMSC074C05]|uniref:ASCH domain-containing protein n=1 Tax=Corynebacterium TaxID=1716 RepID=UPI0008A5A36D|nr:MULTISPECIES: ASCH domain-containing protein [Corynebacterium]MDC7117413.1 ASCH domain-containing protein [Corynebacterium amycolatum]MDK7315112.1 ASCH domain-containing protein [Corynebacterium amycolatum]MEB2597112.1 ASCH domain-containing protein [Corynebacterium amycolatum]OFJ56531.1 CMP deaminase [Corynebacterium sp. HMSC076C10]OHR34711.1 CMP deaminase [Corynebacterium sp. HMSC074C05]